MTHIVRDILQIIFTSQHSKRALSAMYSNGLKGLFLLVIIPILISHNSLAQKILRKTYYDESKSIIKEQFYVKDTIKNQLDSIYTSFYISGVTKSTGNFTDNLADGEWRYYNETGRIKQAGLIENGKNRGNWVSYFENGNLRSEGELNNNVKSGEWVYYFENQNIKSRGFFENDLKQNVWNYFYEDGQLKAQAYFENDEGTYKEFYSNGNLKMEGLNRNGKSDSLWVYYFDTGEKFAEGYFKKGLKTGTWKYFHKNNQIASEGGYEVGKSIGNWIYYHENGAKSAEGIRKNDLKEGFWKLYYDEGTLKGLGEFEHGTGQYSEYFSSGNLKLKGQFKDGLNDGHWNYFDENGLLEGEADFEKGKGIYTGYYEDKTIKMSGELDKNKRIGEWKLYKNTGELAGTYFPLYETEDPIFLTSETIEKPNNKIDNSKPGFRLKSQKLRYFQPKVNEFRGTIISINPAFTLIGELPISLEYFVQERLGFELTYKFLHNPFYNVTDNHGLEKLHSKGHSINFTNKFYSKDQRYGMLYFGQKIGYESITHEVDVFTNSVPILMESSTLSSKEQRWHYALVVGNRWMKNPSKSGLTFDTYIGIGVGFRSYQADYTDSSYDYLFDSVKKSNSYFPVVFGISIGYLGIGKSKAVRKAIFKLKNS